jgi:hypothetical protein
MQRFPFNTLPKGPLNFNVTLDGSPYSAVITWNIVRKGWYLSLFDGFNNRVTTVAVVESPQFADIASAIWNELAGRVILTTVDPHGFPLGAVVEQTVRGANPDALNGTWMMTADSPETLSFLMTADPGNIIAPGSFGRDISLVDGYFKTSVLVYRFETFYAYP